MGLITNQTGVNSRLQYTWQRLQGDPRLRLSALFSPEHGLSGATQAGVPVKNQSRVYSLYGEHRAPTPEMLAEVDVLLYDIQDAGSRFYTYISTLWESLRVAAALNIPLVVLDRPNPINGETIEGPVLKPEFRSFVGVYPLPVRYGMTAGELALFWNREARIEANLRVVPMSHWERSLWYDQTGLEWIPPSPNMPTLATATVYPGMGWIEGTNLSEGRGTTRPFEWIGAPWLDNRRLARELNQLKLSGVYFRTQDFVPSFSKYQGRLCRGVQVHVLNRQEFQPLEAVLYLIQITRQLHPGDFQFLPDVFDRLAGTDSIREDLQQGKSPQSILAHWQRQTAEFRRRRQPFLLY